MSELSAEMRETLHDWMEVSSKDVLFEKVADWLAEHDHQVADEKQQRIDEALALVRTASGRYEQREAGGGLFNGQVSDAGFINYIDRIEAALTGATSNGKEPFERTDEGAPICPHCGMESETDEFEAHLCWGGAEPSRTGSDDA